MAREERRYTAADLYGAGGPRASDIRQDDIFNCYFVAPLGALGERQPDRIRDAIRFSPETGDFTVTLYRPPNAQERGRGQTNPIQESITVSQEDIRRNIREEGGGTVDNNRGRNGPLWPTVIEAGFAEMYGRNSQGQVNLNQGYEVIGSVTRGGSLSDGMYALTGETTRNIRIPSPNARAIDGTGPNHVELPEPPPFRAPSRTATVSVEQAYTEVEQALASGRPVSMATQGREAADGLEEGHAYVVSRVSRDPQTNEPLITLRNPYSNNERAGEGNRNVGPGWNDSNPEITVRLNDLVNRDSFGEFNIGPAPRAQTRAQQPVGTEQTTSPQTPSTTLNTPAPSQAQAADPRDPNHPDHRLYLNVRAGVKRTEADLGRTWDDNSDRLTASLTLLARQKGYGPDDRFEVGFSTRTPTSTPQPGELVFLNRVGGNVSPDPAANRAEMQTTQALAQPADAVYRNLDAYNQAQREAQARTPPEQQPTQTPAGPTPGGPDDPQTPAMRR